MIFIIFFFFVVIYLTRNMKCYVYFRRCIYFEEMLVKIYSNIQQCYISMIYEYNIAAPK